METNYLNSFFHFCGNFLKFALLVFTGAFIIVGILWILFSIIEWTYIGISYLKDMINNENKPVNPKRTISYKNGTTKCINCHMLTPCGPKCRFCGTKLPEDQKLIPYLKGKKKDALDSADISVVQYSERKKHQKIRSPYCNALSRVIEERCHGTQTRRCRNDHIFVYSYESEMLIQDKLNAKYN